jgi:hypothetical protein
VDSVAQPPGQRLGVGGGWSFRYHGQCWLRLTASGIRSFSVHLGHNIVSQHRLLWTEACPVEIQLLILINVVNIDGTRPPRGVLDKHSVRFGELSEKSSSSAFHRNVFPLPSIVELYLEFMVDECGCVLVRGIFGSGVACRGVEEIAQGRS